MPGFPNTRVLDRQHEGGVYAVLRRLAHISVVYTSKTRGSGDAVSALNHHLVCNAWGSDLCYFGWMSNGVVSGLQ